VTTDWVLLDARNRVVRIPADFGVAFTNPEVRSEILRVAAPAGAPAATLDLRVRPSDLDPLDHVNNAVYLDWLEEALEAAGWAAAIAGLPRTYRLEYLASAARGDQVTIALHGAPDGWSATIQRGDGGDLVRAAGSVST
jgi:acyl-ACP thioesterase